VSKESGKRFLLEQKLCVKREGSEEKNRVNNRIECDEEGRSLFTIPIVARSIDDSVERRLLMSKGLLRCSEIDDKSFVIFNHKSLGFYRVLYDESLLVEMLKYSSAILEEELCSIVVDTLFFFQSKFDCLRPSASILMSVILKGLELIKSVYLWHLLLPALSSLLRHLQLSEYYGHVLAALRDPINLFYEKVIKKKKKKKKKKRKKLFFFFMFF
jgi:hypothetical protein